MEYYHNTLCIDVYDLTDGNPQSENPKDWPVMTRHAYDHYVKRNPHVRLRRACRNTPALLNYDLLRRDLRETLKAKLGKDPYAIVPRDFFAEGIKPDDKALDFFRKYKTGNGISLEEPTINEYYTNAAILNRMYERYNEMKLERKARNHKTGSIIQNLSECVNKLDRKKYPHTLPSNYRRLSDKYHRYLKEGYISLIHKSFCNTNTQKIPHAGKMFLLARWANQVERVAQLSGLLEEYNEMALANNWKQLKDTGAIRNYLYRADVKPLWYGFRHGELKAKEKYSMQISTRMPSMRDSLWYSDGTKLNFFYRAEDGTVETCSVYEVMDTYSEMLLGYHISKTEDYEAQYHAYKMAFKTSGHKPYQITYDNQGGHKKLEAGEFLTKIARIAIRTMPYNGKSKTIEQAFGRFQQHVLKKLWYFTGQNITATREESRANHEFLLANRNNFPTKSEAAEAYKKCRDEWNQMKHFATALPKVQMYYASENPKSPKVELWDMVDLFWITRKEPVTCNAYGISFKEKNVKYDYLVYSAPMVPDQEWLWRNVDKKFWIKFDPDDMGLIYLYEMGEKGLRFVTQAETKIVVHRGIQEQEEGEAAFIRQVIDENKRLRVRKRDEMLNILKKQKQDAESYGMVTPPLKGIESSRPKRRKQKEVSYALVEKEISNTTPLENTEEVDYYKYY